MGRREPPRVVGPCEEKNRWRIVVVEKGQRKSFFCISQEEAVKLKSRLARQVDQPTARRLADVIAEWEQDQVRRGACRDRSDLASSTCLGFGSSLSRRRSSG